MNRTVTVMAMLVAVAGLPAVSGASDAPIAEAIRGFARAGDTQDVQALDRVVHSGFRVVFRVAGSDDVTVLDRTKYREMLEAKKLGGSRRKLEIMSVQQSGGMANVHVRMEGTDATFEGVMTLVQNGGRWKLIQDATVYTPKGN